MVVDKYVNQSKNLLENQTKIVCLSTESDQIRWTLFSRRGGAF